MIRNEQSLIHYVEMVTGLRPRLDEAPPPAATLPLFLREQDKLSPVSQLVVIHQILREPDAHIPLAQLGERLAYSPQAMSFAQEELQDAKLCEGRRAGKMVFLEFGLRGKALWEKAAPLMAS